MKKYFEKVFKYAKEMDRKKIIITSVVLFILVYKLFSQSGFGIFDKGEKVVVNDLERGQITSDIESSGINGSKSEDFEKGLSRGDKYSLNSDDIFKNNSKENVPKKISVYISGEVSNPGVVIIDNGKRLDDACKKLGGLTKDADINRINLALKLEDSMHYIIPKKGDNTQLSDVNTSNANTGNTQSGSVSSNNIQNGYIGDNSKIDLNSADQKKLETISGVGPSTAKKIIDYRTKQGGFKTIEDLKNVSGIGDKKFESIKDYVCVNNN